MYAGDFLRSIGLIPAWAGKTARGSLPTRRSPAHPRVGGENKRCSFRLARPVGSSPRGRGKHPSADTARDGRGLIPAWAGKTRRAHSSAVSVRAHPRVGGENMASSLAFASSLGSSPRGRGKRDDLTRRDSPGRLIPAWAGKTQACFVLGVGGGAHPRVGGENLNGDLEKLGGSGSSPRGRGKRASLKDYRALTRLIPAWAGKTWKPRTGVASETAHPRVGGENAFLLL